MMRKRKLGSRIHFTATATVAFKAWGAFGPQTEKMNLLKVTATETKTKLEARTLSGC